jgi:branched-chain amino acid transport system substrate-binding protein
MVKKILFISALFLVMLLSYSVLSAETITIGLTLGLTGKYANTAKMQNNAYKLWADSINKQGGVLGQPIKLIIYDDKSSKEEAVLLYKKLITEDKVDFIFGPYSSGITKAIAPLAEQYNMPMLAPGAASDSIWEMGYRHVFGMWSPASKYPLGFLQMLKLKHISKIAIIFADDGFSIGLAKGAKKWATAMKHDVLLYHQFKKGNHNLTDIAKKVKLSQTKVLMVIGHFNEAIDMKKALKRINWKPEIFYATVAPTLEKYNTTLKSDADLSFSTSHWEAHSGLILPGSEKFSTAFYKRYKTAPSYHATTAYAACQLLRKAILKTNGTNKDKIEEIYRAINTTTVLGKYGVNKKTGIQEKHFPLVIQWQNSKKEIVWPKTLQTAEPIFK